MADELGSSTQPAAMDPTPASSAPTASRDGTPAASFQAINSRAASENARNATPAATGQQRGSSSDLTPPRGDAAVAPKAAQTAQTSTSASQPSKLSSQVDGLDGAMAEASYGTRSRNRTSTRPNYAEDQDMDFEFTSAATTGKKKGLDASAATTQGTSETKRGPDATSFQAVNSNATNAKDSNASTPTAAGTTKKRKAAANTAAALSGNAASATPPPGAARKPAVPTGSSTLARETNIMSFSKHRSCLNKKGELVADDGTKLSVNGKLLSTLLIWLQPSRIEVAAYPAPHFRLFLRLTFRQITCTLFVSRREIPTTFVALWNSSMSKAITKTRLWTRCV